MQVFLFLSHLAIFLQITCSGDIAAEFVLSSYSSFTKSCMCGTYKKVFLFKTQTRDTHMNWEPDEVGWKQISWQWTVCWVYSQPGAFDATSLEAERAENEPTRKQVPLISKHIFMLEKSSVILEFPLLVSDHLVSKWAFRVPQSAAVPKATSPQLRAAKARISTSFCAVSIYSFICLTTHYWENSLLGVYLS